MTIKVIEWLGESISIIDQTELPQKEVYLKLTTAQEMAEAIKEMRIRGAPAIGVAAAYGIALGGQQIEANTPEKFRCELEDVIELITATRPTAVNLFTAADRMKKVSAEDNSVEKIKQALVAEAIKIHEESRRSDESISLHGAELLEKNICVLTHCNAGPLATAGYGTALGVIFEAHRQGKIRGVIATETRPLCQGSRLTTWELKRGGVPVKLITDSMAGHFIIHRAVDAIIVGADRIAKNGDTANKIGTYALAVLAKENGIPFYVAAPTSTIDQNIASGGEIPIEERDPSEVTHIRGQAIAPEEVEALNPAFDVTPHRYITAIITEKGIIRSLLRKA